MIPLLRRRATGLCRLVAVAAILLPSVADAQSPSTNMRAAPATKSRPPAKKPVQAAAPWILNPAIASRDAYLIADAESGRELLSDRPDDLRHPASLTKLMTLYLAFSALDSGRLSLADALPVSTNALNAAPTKMGLSGSVPVRDAIMGLVTRSANDAALVLATKTPLPSR
jgi:D-alanyl-D-alanine carboxypeptidase